MFENFFLLLIPLYYCSSIDWINLKHKALHDAVELVTISRDRDLYISEILHLVTSLEEAKVVLCSLIIKQIQSKDYSDVAFRMDLKDLMLKRNQFFNDLMYTPVYPFLLDNKFMYIKGIRVNVILSSDSLGYLLLSYDILHAFTIGTHLIGCSIFCLKQSIMNELVDFMNNSIVFTRLDFRVLWFLRALPEHFYDLISDSHIQEIVKTKQVSMKDQLLAFSKLIKALLNLFCGKPVDIGAISYKLRPSGF